MPVDPENRIQFVSQTQNGIEGNGDSSALSVSEDGEQANGTCEDASISESVFNRNGGSGYVPDYSTYAPQPRFLRPHRPAI
jgi:hypothetical protein